MVASGVRSKRETRVSGEQQPGKFALDQPGAYSHAARLIASTKSPSILKLDVNVEPYLDLHPIGVFYPDATLGCATLLVFPEAQMSP